VAPAETARDRPHAAQLLDDLRVIAVREVVDRFGGRDADLAQERAVVAVGRERVALGLQQA
jgi:hypothetical protein